MTHDEIFKMAKSAGFNHSFVFEFFEETERFAAIVAAAEREACAKVCENDSGDGPENGCCPTYWEEATEACAAAIRARGNT